MCGTSVRAVIAGTDRKIQKEVENIYRGLGELMKQDNTWSCYVITSMEYFESLFGRKADKKRKLFNGRIKTDYYQFEGPRPPR